MTPEILSAQSLSAVRKEKEKSEKEIAYLNKLLNEAKNDKSVSIGKLNILRQKIVQSKKILASLNEEVRYLESGISVNESRINELETEKKSMLNLYSKLVYGTWKKRDKTNKMMFIFSSSDFNQAYNRFKYFEQIQEYSKRQLDLIRQINDSLTLKNNELKNLVDVKNNTLKEVNVKSKEIESEQSKENSYIQELQKKEKELNKKLQIEKKNRQKLDNEINRLIALQTKKSGGSSVYKMTPEEKLISDDFAKNKGKLPWPVAEGFVSEKYGVYADIVHKNVKIEHGGISITTSNGTDVRSVFQGTVINVVSNLLTNNIVLIMHGDYVTVYSNLMSVNVKEGQKVKTKDIIGKVAPSNEKGSVLDFQIWKNNQKFNPELWLTK